MTIPAEGTAVTAVALDGSFDAGKAAAQLPWQELRRYPYGTLLELRPGEQLMLFDFGAVAHVGKNAADVETLRMVEAVTACKVLYRTAETYTLIEAPEGVNTPPRVDWDRIALPDDRPDLVTAACLLLAQSAALERFEHAADRLVEETLLLAQDLKAKGRPPSRSSALMKKIGSITSERLLMTSWFYLVDRPEETWRDQKVADLYEALFHNLEMPRRHEALLHKLRAVEDATEIFIDLGHGRQSTQLEWAVVLLIVFEILLSLWEHFFSGAG